jgi:cyclophilin family peptidyl-prolyl cis-trans isomerase/HEAT repeat protein
MRPLRLAILPATLLLHACLLVPARQPAAPAPALAPVAEVMPPRVYGFTPEEEATLLRLEDRREYDPVMAHEWLAKPNALHRQRMALALGRIGAATFVDSNHNGEHDANEHQVGVDDLAPLVSDDDPAVRTTAAFALGQTGDVAAAESLFRMAHDADASVAAEAVEALSRLAPKIALARYAELTRDTREGVRARAVRFLFRFRSDEAMAMAAATLEASAPVIRRESVYALSRRAYAPARERLELLITDPDTLTRAYAAGALGRIAAPESLVPVFTLTRDAQPWVRTNAVLALAQIAAKDNKAIVRPELGQDALNVIALADDPDPGMRVSALPALGWYATRSRTAREKLLDVAVNGARVDREQAAGILASHFAELLSHETSGIRENATPWVKVRMIEGYANDAAKNDLARSMMLGYLNDTDPMVRAAVIGNIPDAMADANVTAITAALSDADVIVRANAIGKYAATSAANQKLATLRAAYERASHDAMNDARLEAIRGIAGIDDAGRETFLRNLLSDGDPVVRRLAADQIEQTLKKPRPQYTPLAIEKSVTDYLPIVAWSHQQHTAVIHMTRGNVTIALLTRDAPMTTWNFAQLANKHYFDATSFMRVVPNFVVQGGDPRNDMNGGPGYAIRDEINMQKYSRGAVGMALSGPDTGGSQFFVTHSAQPHLDGGYTIFGRVTGGLAAVIDETERGDRVDSITIQ